MRRGIFFSTILTLIASCTSQFIENSPQNSTENRSRLIFNIVRFTNSPCGSGTMVGTCYTADECTTRGGTAGVACASGYGTCCIFTLDCGGTTVENSTTLVQTARTTDCTYTICRCSDDICRIRFDFQTFMIAPPDNMASVAGAQTFGNCLTDSFVVTGDLRSSPVICGVNTGQHLIVEAQDACNTAFFDIGTGAATRNWNINVTQFRCGDPNGGPTGCLQYFTSNTGIVDSFNFNLPITGAPAVHLANQDYNVCFRRNNGNCRICYGSVADPSGETFGLSISTSAKITQSGINSDCKTDYIEIPGGVPISLKTPIPIVLVPSFRNCGRFLNSKIGQQASVCSFAVPFRFRFVTDGNEMITIKNGSPKNSEVKGTPSGAIGYRLFFKQMACA